MKYVVALLIAGLVYLTVARPPHTATAVSTEASEPGTDFLKEPLDRTHDVLKQAKARTQDPALQ